MKINNSATIIPQKSPSFGSAATMGERILSGNLSKFAKAIEFNSMNMPFPVLLVTMFGGVLGPRLIKAQDKYDREEILRRDSISISTIAVGAPILSKMFSKINEMKSGLALAIKPDNFDSKNIFKKVFDYLRPINGVHVLSSSEIVSKYSDIENFNSQGKEGKKGIEGFCNFIDTQKGNLKKLFGQNDKTRPIIEEICGGKEAFGKANNKSIIESIETAVKDSPEKIAELCTHFKDQNNSFVKKAKSTNSAFGFISMVLLVPGFLGILLPKINEKITKRKIAENKNPGKNTKLSNDHPIYQNPYFMAVAQPTTKEDKSVFNRFKKNN